MDRYEFNLKTQQMRKLSAAGRYEEAALIADEIDWSRVKNTRLLMLTADIYEATKQPEKEFDILDIAYERSPMGKQLAYRLALVASELKEYEEAEIYYKDFVDMAPRDSRRYLLRYRLSRARGEDLDMLIGLLERYLDGDMEERWSYELCELYAKAGYQDKCVSLCDDLIAWFGDGKYVLAALKLKKKYAHLSVSQQQKYNELRREARENSAEEDDEIGAEIARTRNEVIRNRTLPEKMQAVAEKRIQDDAVIGEKKEPSAKEADENPQEKRAGAQAQKKSRSGAKAKEGKKSTGNRTAGKGARNGTAAKGSGTGPTPKIAGMEAPVKNAEINVTVKKAEDRADVSEKAPTPTEKVDGTTRRYDGRAVRQAEARMRNAGENEDIFELQDEKESQSTEGVLKPGEEIAEATPDFDVDEIHIKTYSDRAYDTMNIQAELAKSMEAILRTDETRGGQKPARRSGSRGSGPAVRTYIPPATEVAEEDPFGYEQEIKEPEKQITGQMSIEEILKDLQTRGILKEDTVESALRVTGQTPLGKTQENGGQTDGQPSEEPAGEEQRNEEIGDVEKNGAAGVSEESVVKEMEEVSLRDFVTGEIDLEIVQDEVDERLKVENGQSSEKMPDQKISDPEQNSSKESEESVTEAVAEETVFGGVVSAETGEKPEETPVEELKFEEMTAEGTVSEGMASPESGEKSEETPVEELKFEEMTAEGTVSEEMNSMERMIKGITFEEVTEEIAGRNDPEKKEELPEESGRADFEEETEMTKEVDTDNLEVETEESKAGSEIDLEEEMNRLEEVGADNSEVESERMREAGAVNSEEETELPEEAGGDNLKEDAEQPEEGIEAESEKATVLDEEKIEQPEESEESESEEDAEQPEESIETESEEAEVLDEEEIEQSEESEGSESEEDAEQPEENIETESEEAEVLDEEESEQSEESEGSESEEDAEQPEEGIEAESEEAEVLDEEESGQSGESVENDSEEDAEQPEEDAEVESEEAEVLDEEESEQSEEIDEESEEDETEAEPEETEEDEIQLGEEEGGRHGSEDFLTGLEQDLSRLGQEGNPYTQMRNEDEKRETQKMDDVFAVIKEMETDLSEEDRIYNAYTEEEPKEKLFLNETDRKEFEQYLKINGMESQIAKAINDYVAAYNNDGTSKNPNILITGGAKTGKSQLAVSLIRTINRHLGRNGRKTARISGFNLNRKTLSASMPRLVGNDLLIEHAGEINRKIVAELMDILPKYTGGMIVVMEDEKARLDHLFEDYPLLAGYFPNHLDIKEYDINEWAAVAKSYARSQGYTIDELGTLALYAEIDALYGMLQGLEVDDIKDIIDEAIEHSERKMGSAFSKIFGKKKDTERKILHETDFDT